MEVCVWLLLAFSASLVTVSETILPERTCSTSITLRTCINQPEKSQFTDFEDITSDCMYLSDHLKQYNAIIAADDCIEIKLSPGTYMLVDYNTPLNYSLVMRAIVPSTVNISCRQQVDQELTTGSPFWFQRYNAFTSHHLPILNNDDDGEFYVQIEGILFENCQRPLQFDAMDYVGLLNCSFSGFNSSAVDMFNCQNVQIEHSSFYKNSAMLKKEQYRANSGGLSIAYHTTNETLYFNPSLSPSVQVTDCDFYSNTVNLPENNTRQQIDQALNNHIYFGRGGGLGIFLDEYFIDIEIDIQRCTFDSNYAESFGGGLYIYVDGSNTQHNFTISDCNFTLNTAGNFGGGIQVALLIRNANKDPSRLDFIHCNFFNNTASFGGGLSSVQVYSQGAGNVISLSDSHFEGNQASDVGSGVMFASLLYVLNRKLSHYYEVSNNVFLKNTSPGGTFAVGFIPQNFTGHNWFMNNTGPGLRSVGSQIAVNGSLSFIGNNAESYEGGALYISAFGQLKLYRGSHIDFIENIGRIGSAIVVDVQRTSQVFSRLIFNTQCFLIYENATKPPDEWDQVSVTFSGNRAAVAPVVYTSHLDLCSWFSVTSDIQSISNHIESTFSTPNFTQWPAFDYSSNNNNATSHPQGVLPKFYFQTEALKVSQQSNNSDQTRKAYPGQKIQLNIEGLDQFNLPTYLIARVSDSRADINNGAFSQTTDDDFIDDMNVEESVRFEPALIPITPNDHSVEVVYQVPTKKAVTENISVIVDTPYNVIDSMQLSFNLTYTTCLPGYELQSRGDEFSMCTCQDSTFSILDCDETNNVIFLKNGLWAGVTNDTNPQLKVHVCPIPYCHCSDDDVTCDSLYYHDDHNENKQCHNFREGTLCGRCVNDTSVGVLRFNCRDCGSNKYWAIGFLVVGDCLVCVAILFALVKLRYPFPHSMKGLLFYIQTVYYTTEYFPASFWSARQYMLYLGSALGLYFPWDFCLAPGTSALASFPPRFVPPVIATLVAIAAVVSVFYCFEKRAQKRIWHGLWVFILLMYAPLVHTCLSLLHCPSIPPTQGGDAKPRWFLDGEVLCYRDGGHTALAVIAILILPFICLLPPAIFIFTVFIYPSLKTKYPIAERLYEAVTAGYTEKARWWGAWDLARRFILISVVISLPGRSVSTLYIVAPALALHLYTMPYLRLWQNLFETLILTNYCLLHLLQSTQAILDDLSKYYGTATPQSRGKGLAKTDNLTVLLSVWYYLPLLMGAITILVLLTKNIVRYVQVKRTRRRAVTNRERIDSTYRPYIVKKTAVTVTDVSLN